MTRSRSAGRTPAPRAAAAVLAAAVFIAVTLTLLGGCVPVPINEDTLFQPKESVTIGTFDHPEATLQELFFESDDGTRINAWYLSHPEPRATVLFFGGYGFYLVQSRPYIDHFLEQGVNALLIDYRGYGRSEGEPSVGALKDDGLAAWEMLTAEFGIDPRELVIHGHSLGTFMATYVAEQREAAGLVLENPATTARGWTRAAVPWYLRLILSFDIDESFEAEDNLERIATVGEHLLVLAGGEDMVTPSEMAEELYAAADSAQSRDRLLIEEGSHPDLHEFDAYGTAYRRLIDRLAAE
ncbi:MAG: alpha/beta hydrolase [Spirochaetota bacterium]